MAFSGAQVTRLGLSGTPRFLYGSFAGKVASPPVFSGTIPTITADEGDADVITDLSTYFSGATSYSISPTVEAGWNFDTVTGILTVDTDYGFFGPYIVTGTNVSGSVNSNNFSVTMTFAGTSTAAGKQRIMSVTESNRDQSTESSNRKMTISKTNRKLN
jgi:hypothetical protein